MKNIFAISALAAGVLFSAGAMAGQMTASGVVTTAQCMDTAGVASKLTNDVNVTLSANVQAAYVCNVTGTNGVNSIHVGACSTAGSTKSRTISCTVTGTAPDGVTPVYNDASCNGTAGQTFTGIGPSAYTANSAGGQVTPNFLGTTATTTCTAANIETRLQAIAAQ